jgi:hypothetical protein
MNSYPYKDRQYISIDFKNTPLKHMEEKEMFNSLKIV